MESQELHRKIADKIDEHPEACRPAVCAAFICTALAALSPAVAEALEKILEDEAKA